MKKLLLLVALSSSMLTVMAQRKPAMFAIQFRPSLPASLYNGGLYDASDSLDYKTTSQFGYSFGMLVHKDISKTLTIESGLVFTERNFELDVTDLSGAEILSTRYQVVAYEIPVNLLAYIRAADNQYVTVALGIVGNFLPSDVAGGEGEYIHETVRRRWAQGAINANIGWEMRFTKGDALYAGASVHLPWNDLMYSRIGNINSNKADIVLPLGGSYLSLDFRYMFASKADKD